MKLLQVFNSRVKKHGSFEDYMIELARQARARGYTLGFVFAGIETQAVRSALEAAGAEVAALGGGWKDWKFQQALVTMARDSGYDTIDFHFCSAVGFSLLFMRLRLMGKRVVFHYHGEIQPIENLTFKNHHLSRLRLVTLPVHKIICVSHANRRYLRALKVKGPIEVVYNGIEVERFRNIKGESAFRRASGIGKDELVVTSIGTLIPRKGMDVLIRAAAAVLKQVPQARFVIIGGGDPEPYRKLARELDIEDRVLLTGLIKEYPFEILRTTDLFVSASLAESFGLSIAEAQVMGIPVVATRVGGVPEVVDAGRTGLLVNSGDHGELANAIIQLLSSPDRRESLALEGPLWIEAKFDLKDRVSELLDVISQ